MDETSQPGLVYVNRDMTEGELHPLGPGLAAVFTSRCPSADPPNEDSCAIIPFDDKSGVLVVADGAGGLPGGARASEASVNAMRTSIRNAQRRGQDLKSAILDGIEKAHAAVTRMAIGAGTTLAVAEINGPKVRSWHVGDSQIMVVGQKGKIKLFTKSHSPVGYAVEAGLLDEKEAIHHDERHLVSNLIGFPHMHIEIGPVVDLAPKDTVLIASDGLFDNLHTSEIVDACRKGQLLAIASGLSARCQSRMTAPAEGEPSKPDDLTFIAYRHRVTTD